MALIGSGMSFAAVGRRLGIAKGTVNQYVQRHRMRESKPTVEHRCQYHDCEHPLPIAGVCWPGAGNPACVARGDRPTITPHGKAPFGWANNDGAAVPHPEEFPLLVRIYREVSSGAQYSTVARKLGLSPKRVWDAWRLGVPLLRKALPC